MKTLVCLAVALGFATLAAAQTFTYNGPSPTPTPLSGSLLYSTSTPVHGVPFTCALPAASSGLQVSVDGTVVGTTGNSGVFTLIINTTGIHKIGVAGYPDQSVTVS